MRHVYFILPLFALLPLTLTGQACDGNLGENIFTAGDFGSGGPNIVPTDPGIAPGFQYQPAPPPQDGFYTITADMRQWNGTFPTWDAFPDNSNGQGGYMMVVNAAFEPGKFYEQQVDDLCENTLYQFTADVRNVLKTGTNGLRPDVSFLINDEIRFTTGPIGETERWNQYGFTFTTEPGQTSVTLALSNNAPGGFGNDLAIDNITFRACGPLARIAGAESISVCEDADPSLLTSDIDGDQYDTPAVQWQRSPDGLTDWADLPGATDFTYLHTERASGFYHYRYLLANGDVNLGNSKCRVISNVKTVYVVPKRYAIVDTLCAGLTFTVGTSVYGTTGVSVDTLVSSLGCDSIVTLDLTVVPDPGLVPDFATVDPSCSYLTDGSLLLRGVGGAVAPVRYVLDTTLRSVGDSLTGLGEGAYTYTLTDRYGCTTTGTVRLRSPNPFSVELGPDRTLALGEEVRLTTGASGPVAAYSFTPPDLTDCTTGCAGLTLTPARSVTVGLTATSPAGCVATDSLRLVVIDERRVFVPTAFSPNDDGINDRFTVFGDRPGAERIVSLRVFDRWGGQVFEARDLDVNEIGQGWDGRVDGQPAAPGTYFYVTTVRFLNGVAQEYRGAVTLLR